MAPVLPPSYPLAGGNPYLSAWLPGGEAAHLPSAVPRNAIGRQLNWSVVARVDDKAYNLFGLPFSKPEMTPGKVRGATFTATHSTFTVDAGIASFNLDFFTPVSPNNHMRHSLPFSYLTVSASSGSDRIPSIQLYSDVDSSWAGNFGGNAEMGWNSVASADGTIAMSLTPINGGTFLEDNGVAQSGAAIYSSRPSGELVGDIKYAVGDLDRMRSYFAEFGEISHEGQASTS